jgi:hypothetical protein
MPVCFSLTDRATNEVVALQEVDDKMRLHFREVPDPVNWYRNWYNAFGFSLALGETFAALTKTFPEYADVLEWLSTNYTVNNWREMR